MDTTERDLLMLSQRLMLMLLSSTELTDMVLDTEPTDMDTHMPMVPMDTMERDLLMLSQRLMLIPISCTEDMALDMPDITDMLDTHTPTDTMERDLLMLSQRLMLPTSIVDTTDMPDLMPMDTVTGDHQAMETIAMVVAGDKSYTPCKNSTKEKLKANNILL